MGIDQGGYYGPWVNTSGYYKGIRPPGLPQRARNAALLREIKAWNRASNLERSTFRKVVQSRYREFQRPLDDCLGAGPV